MKTINTVLARIASLYRLVVRCVKIVFWMAVLGWGIKASFDVYFWLVSRGHRPDAAIFGVLTLWGVALVLPWFLRNQPDEVVVHRWH